MVAAQAQAAQVQLDLLDLRVLLGTATWALVNAVQTISQCGEVRKIIVIELIMSVTTMAILTVTVVDSLVPK